MVSDGFWWLGFTRGSGGWWLKLEWIVLIHSETFGRPQQWRVGIPTTTAPLLGIWWVWSVWFAITNRTTYRVPLGYSLFWISISFTTEIINKDLPLEPSYYQWLNPYSSWCCIITIIFWVISQLLSSDPVSRSAVFVLDGLLGISDLDPVGILGWSPVKLVVTSTNPPWAGGPGRENVSWPGPDFWGTKFVDHYVVIGTLGIVTAESIIRVPFFANW